MENLVNNLLRFRIYIESIGTSADMEEYERRKVSLFNILNILGLISGIVIALVGIFSNVRFPPLAWFIAYSPLAISITVLWMNHERYHELSRLFYFSFYPLATCLVYVGKVDLGVELFFVLYGILSVFFLKKLLNIIVAVALSVACYILSVTITRDYYFHLKYVNFWFYLF